MHILQNVSRILSNFNSLCYPKMSAIVNCRLIWPFLVTGTEDLLAGMSTVGPVKALCNSLTDQLFLDRNLGKIIYIYISDTEVSTCTSQINHSAN